MAFANLVRCETEHKTPWILRERLHEREIAELITAYRHGATSASLATTHGVSPSSVKRLLRAAGVRRTPSNPRSREGHTAHHVSVTRSCPGIHRPPWSGEPGGHTDTGRLRGRAGEGP